MSTVISRIQFRNGHFYLLPKINFDKNTIDNLITKIFKEINNFPYYDPQKERKAYPKTKTVNRIALDMENVTAIANAYQRLRNINQIPLDIPTLSTLKSRYA